MNAFWSKGFIFFSWISKLKIDQEKNSKYIGNILYWHPPFQASISSIIAFFFSFGQQLWIILNWSDRQGQKAWDSQSGGHKIGLLSLGHTKAAGIRPAHLQLQLLTVYCDSRNAKLWNPCLSRKEDDWYPVTSVLPTWASFFFLFSGPILPPPFLKWGLRLSTWGMREAFMNGSVWYCPLPSSLHKSLNFLHKLVYLC